MNFKNEARMQELGEKEDDFAFYRMLHKEYIAALENFVKLRNDEYELESKAIIFLDEKMLTHVEKIVNSEIQSEE